jgi:hypothetical protein
MVMYVLHLPVKDNNGKPFNKREFTRVRDELIEKFGGCTFYPQAQKGFWVHKGVVFEDDVVVFEVWVRRTQKNLAWLSEYGRVLRKRFKQKSIGAKLVPFETVE